MKTITLPTSPEMFILWLRGHTERLYKSAEQGAQRFYPIITAATPSTENLATLVIEIVPTAVWVGQVLTVVDDWPLKTAIVLNVCRMGPNLTEVHLECHMSAAEQYFKQLVSTIESRYGITPTPSGLKLPIYDTMSNFAALVNEYDLNLNLGDSIRRDFFKIDGRTYLTPVSRTDNGRRLMPITIEISEVADRCFMATIDLNSAETFITNQERQDFADFCAAIHDKYQDQVETSAPQPRTNLPGKNKPILTPNQQHWFYIVLQSEYEHANHAGEYTEFCKQNGLNYETYKDNKRKLKNNPDLNLLAWVTDKKPAEDHANVIKAIIKKRDEGWENSPKIYP